MCEQKDCEEKRCPRRHLKQCKNWQKSTCKFGNNCEYKHDPIMKKANETIVLEINEVDSEVEVNDNDSNSSESAMDIINMESSLQNKNETVFSKPNKFTCENCEFMSKTKSNLSKHVKDNHKHTCDECGHKATSNQHLKMHVKSCHQNFEIETEEKAKINSAKKVETKKRKSINDNNDILSLRKKSKI